MDCHRCQTALQPDVRFCSHCGARQSPSPVRVGRASPVRGDRGRGALSRFELSSRPGEVTIEIPWNRVVRVGRHPSTDITMLDQSVSRFHAELITTEDGCLVRDLHSSNGTFVNGVSIRELTLRHRDELQFGNVQFLVRERRAGDDAAAPPLPISLEEPVKGAPEPRLEHLIALSASLASQAPRDDLLAHIVQGALHATGAERASVAWLDGESDELITGAFESRSSRHHSEHRIPRSIARHCIKEGVAVVTASAQQDTRFSGRSLVALGVGSAMCAPIIDTHGKTLGVCYVDKSCDGPPFAARDLSYLVALSSIAAAAMDR